MGWYKCIVLCWMPRMVSHQMDYLTSARKQITSGQSDVHSKGGLTPGFWPGVLLDKLSCICSPTKRSRGAFVCVCAACALISAGCTGGNLDVTSVLQSNSLSAPDLPLTPKKKMQSPSWFCWINNNNKKTSLPLIHELKVKVKSRKLIPSHCMAFFMWVPLNPNVNNPNSLPHADLSCLNLPA